MASDLESVPSSQETPQTAEPANWLKMGALAVASALAAGFAVNWFYRKTLTRLRQAEAHVENPEFQIRETGSDEDD